VVGGEVGMVAAATGLGGLSALNADFSACQPHCRSGSTRCRSGASSARPPTPPRPCSTYPPSSATPSPTRRASS
jgi:hypothetical protein